jgi:hypothetical protein
MICHLPSSRSDLIVCERHPNSPAPLQGTVTQAPRRNQSLCYCFSPRSRGVGPAVSTGSGATSGTGGTDAAVERTCRVARALVPAARRFLVVAAFRPAARRFRVVAAFAPAALRLSVVAAFRAAALRFRVVAAFFTEDTAMPRQSRRAELSSNGHVDLMRPFTPALSRYLST